MLDGRFRGQIETWVKPIGNSVRRAGISADAMTCAGIGFAVACAISIGTGHLSLGVLLLALTGIPDMLDGAVAKASGKPSKRGAFFDSVSDRVTDGLLFGGVAWYFTTIYDNALPLLPFFVYASASWVSYIRAKADALGFDARGGMIERAERFLLLGVGLLFSQILVPVLFVMLALNLITAGQRFVKVWRQASAPTPRPPRSRTRRRPRSTTTSRGWRARATARSAQRTQNDR